MREADLDSVRGKADDVEEETGMCTPRDRRDRGPGTQGRIHRDNVGKVPPAAGAGAVAQMEGTYNLIPEKIDLHGTLRTEAAPSNTTHGIKSAMLKVLILSLRKNVRAT